MQLFQGMKEGHYAEGSHVLRAKIDMSSSNMLMRDPIMYRILHKPHHRTNTDWCIYPMYDWTHGESDYIEQVSHSLCTLEFAPHRELYDWFLDQVVVEKKLRPKQREFARRNLSHTVVSKRKLLQLVEKGCKWLGRSKNAHYFRIEKKRIYTRIYSEFCGYHRDSQTGKCGGCFIVGISR